MKVFRFLLFPFAIMYDFVTRVRNLFFDLGIFLQTSFNIPVFIVGNLSLGGTGKTPQIEYLIRLLVKDHRIAILSRGYKRKTEGFVLVESIHSAEDVGDEPLQYFQKFKNISVAVDANRVSGIRRLLKSVKPDIILLDDAFQHRKVKGSCSILLTKYDDLFVDDFLLPTGNLRESQRGAKRANMLLVTKCPRNISKKQQNEIKHKLAKFGKEVFFTSIKYADEILGAHIISTQRLRDNKVLLITGIANPTPLLNYLTSLKIDFEHLKFPDHHRFSERELGIIQNKFDEIQAPSLMLTTEKDYVRLSGALRGLSYLPIETVFLNNENKMFDRYVNGFANEEN
jgi:tetraacyldisaccharide 4'-kinase